jgi:hypothetical protein
VCMKCHMGLVFFIYFYFDDSPNVFPLAGAATRIKRCEANYGTLSS